MARLKEPIEFLEMDDQGVMELKILDFEVGETYIIPRDGRPGHDIPVLRVHVSKEDKNFFPPYWDISSKRLTAQIQPVLEAGGYQDKLFRIQKFGYKPRAHFTVEVETLPAVE